MWASSCSQCADGGLNPLQSLYCVEMQMGWGPAMKLTLVARQQVYVSSHWPSGSVTVCGCSSVAAPQKGAQGVGED